MTRPIHQSQAGECGLAALAMVAAHNGPFLGLAELRARFPQSGKGVNLKQLMGYASALGLAGRPLRLELAELPKLARPCVLHWDLNHFVGPAKFIQPPRPYVDGHPRRASQHAARPGLRSLLLV
ncbi:MAG: cysteine peptidase family C39 domain-containing protein [Dolichospermum sp.]